MNAKIVGAGIVVCAFLAGPAHAEVPNVVASIAPIHSLTAAVMEGMGEPELLVPGSVSDHDYVLKPSDIRKIAAADLVVWIGEPLETYLVKPLQTEEVDDLELIEAPGIDPHPYEGGAEHEAEEGEEANHQHGEDASVDHHDATATVDRAEGDGHGHSHVGLDPHVWLDPVRAQAIVLAVADRLAEMDAENAGRYRQNAAVIVAELQALDAEIRTALAQLADRAFITFHDGYSYFVERYGLRQVGQLTVDPEQRPGVATMQSLRALVQAEAVSCIFSEPQFDADVLASIAGEAALKVGLLDAIGSGMEAGPQLYAALLRRNAEAVQECLSPNS